ncbi:hypothetical protein BaRGS_00016918, partial [Batillaria attramentaria]
MGLSRKLNPTFFSTILRQHRPSCIGLQTSIKCGVPRGQKDGNCYLSPSLPALTEASICVWQESPSPICLQQE